MFEVRVEAEFEAGHRRGPDGEEVPLHHHQWRIAAHARSADLDHIGLVVDFRVLRSAVDETIGELDQLVLEDVAAFAEHHPTAPVVAAFIFEGVRARLGRMSGGEQGTEPDGSHEFWLSSIEVEADPGTRYQYLPD